MSFSFYYDSGGYIHKKKYKHWNVEVNALFYYIIFFKFLIGRKSLCLTIIL